MADPAKVDPRFLLDDAKAERIETVITQTWPESIAPEQLGTDALADRVRAARAELLEALDLAQLI